MTTETAPPIAPAYPTMDEIKSELLLLAEGMQDVDLVVGVSRAGMIPATMLAQILHIPMAIYFPETKDGLGGFISAVGRLEGKKLVFVDELIAKGRTLVEVCAFAKEEASLDVFTNEWKFLALFVDKDVVLGEAEKSRLITTGLTAKYAENWVHFPWEPPKYGPQGSRLLYRDTLGQKRLQDLEGHG